LISARLIAVLLMVVGIGAISILTATVASYFLDQDKEEHLSHAGRRGCTAKKG
jgi:hypothetical protein